MFLNFRNNIISYRNMFRRTEKNTFMKNISIRKNTFMAKRNLFQISMNRISQSGSVYEKYFII